MKITPIQTGTVAIRPRQVRGAGGPLRVPLTLISRGWSAPMPMRAWLIEHPEGLIVVDTGETARVNEPGYFPSWHIYYRRCIRQWITPDDEIGPQLAARSASRRTTSRWVVLTHLHTDHAGGLPYFPRSEVVVSRAEWEFASGFMGRQRGYLNRQFPCGSAPTLVEGDHALDGGGRRDAARRAAATRPGTCRSSSRPASRASCSPATPRTRSSCCSTACSTAWPRGRAWTRATHARLRRLVARAADRLPSVARSGCGGEARGRCSGLTGPARRMAVEARLQA